MISFPEVAHPAVSIVMVTYGGWSWVSEALAAIVGNTRPCYEVIVVDNASPDGTGAELERSVRGATIVRNDRNLGFGGGANQGALHAVGRYLFFLNSDAFVQPGWLPPLLDVLDGDARAGAAAPCLVDPDGTLQEAGGLLGEAGFAVQHGLGADAGRYEFRFRRRADFASAAALLIRRRDFLAAGGFDPAYGLGYFEDADLCLDLWERGLATVYEPGSRVVHLRGASTNLEEAQRRAILSHAVFLRRWAERLALRTTVADADTYPHRVLASRDARAPDRILVLEPLRPPVEATSRQSLLVEELSALWPEARVTVLATDGAVSDDTATLLLVQGVEVAAEDGDIEAWLRSRRFHYSVVVLRGIESLRMADVLLRRFQPQALRVVELHPTDSDGGSLGLRMDASDVAVCATEEQRLAIAAQSPGLATFVLPSATTDLGTGPDLRRAALTGIMAEVGLTPPMDDRHQGPDRLTDARSLR